MSERSPRQLVAQHLPALDGLRLCCCLMVVVGHAAWGPVTGRMASFGVDCFFALSGFLITRLLLRERARTGTLALGAFLARRTLRIAPVYWASIVVAFGLTWLLGERFTAPFHGPNDARFFSSTLGAYAFFVGNWSDGPVPSSIEVLWSVCVEEQFYLLFPPLLLLSRSARPVVLPACVTLLGAWVCRTWLAAHGDAELYRNTLAHADGLLCGALLAQLIEAQPERLIAWVRRHAVSIEAIVCIAIGAHLVFRSASVSPLSYWWSFFASAVLATLLVGVLVIAEGPLARTLARPALMRGGALTYAGYVVHMYAVTAAFGLTHRLAPGAFAKGVRMLLSVAMTLALGWVVHRVIERPFLRLKDRLPRR